MGFRVTEDEVREIVSSELTTLIPFIRVANKIINRVFADRADVDNEMKSEMELWIAAHFVCQAEPQIEREKIGDADTQYNLPMSRFNASDFMGLKGTTYGRAAITIDPTGLLLELAKNRTAIEAYGVEDAEVNVVYGLYEQL